jgi:hypothetical protein
MPRKNTAEYRAYMKEYMKRKRLGLTGINKIVVRPVGWNSAVQAESESNSMVGGNGLEPMTSAMSTQCSNQLS